MNSLLFNDAITPLMFAMVVIIFAVELTANLANGNGAIALLHLAIIGMLAIVVLGLLVAALVRKTRSLLKPRGKQVRPDGNR